MSLLSWGHVLEVMAEACGAADDDRRVLVVLADRAYHVREVLRGAEAGENAGMLGFVVYTDDPELAQRTAETSLLFVRPEQVLRVQVLGYDPAAEAGQLGFG